MIQIKEGIYDIGWFDKKIRIIVLSRVSKVSRNAIWQLYSAESDGVQFGAHNYRWRIPDISSIINVLFEKYKIEGLVMPYTIEDFKKDYVLEHIHKLPPDERLKGLSSDERLKGLSSKELINALSRQFSTISKEEKEELLKQLLNS